MTELERRLADLGDHLDVPAGDGLAAAVVGRLGESRRRPVARWLAAAAVLLAGGAAVTPAVAGWLGTDEVAIEQRPAPTTAPGPTTTTTVLDLGRPATLAEAEAATGFAPIVPAALGQPDEVWLDQRPATPVVWLRWLEEGVLLTELVGHLPDEPVMRKFVDGATVSRVAVGRRPAFWIDGAHEVVLEDHEGELVHQQVRTADRTLVIDMASFTVRLELAGDLDEAMRIARSLPGT